MSKEIHEWATTAATNAFAPADGGCAEGWTGKDVNNAARERMRAIAQWYRAQEFARTLFNEAPYGAKAFVRISNTEFRVTTIDCTSTFPVGRRIRVYDNVGGSVDVFVQSRTFVGGGPYTQVICHGGPNLPGTITDVGVTTNPSIAPISYGGFGTTAARDAIFVTVPPDGVLWFNTTTNTMMVSNGGVWRSLISIDPSVVNWSSGNDGAGSTLDADLLDGVQLVDIWPRYAFTETNENVQANIPGATTTTAVGVSGAGTSWVKVYGTLQVNIFDGGVAGSAGIDLTLERKVNAGAFASFKTHRPQIDTAGAFSDNSRTHWREVAIKTAFVGTPGDSYQFRLSPVSFASGSSSVAYVANGTLGGHVNQGSHSVEVQVLRTA